jgi:hypothetical protein
MPSTTKRGAQIITVGRQGPAGAAGVSATGVQVNFAWGDATPATIAVVAANKVVYGVELVITEPFDGTGASVVVGDAGQSDRLMATIENDLTQVGSSTTSPACVYGVSTAVTLTITPGAGATQGKGVVILLVQL